MIKRIRHRLGIYYRAARRMLGLDEPNPYFTYESAWRLQSDQHHVDKWAEEHRAEIVVWDVGGNLAGWFPRSASEADALLSAGGCAFGGDPLQETRVASVTQAVMRPDGACPLSRDIWCEALLRALKSAHGFERAAFLLDQLGWCGTPAEVPSLTAFVSATADAHLREVAERALRCIQTLKGALI